jgi:predicted molibdopterin-dependent oxidoreductase YjgC
MTNSIACVEKAKAILVIGSNTTENHPIIGDRVKRAVVQKGAKLIVVDPRKIELNNFANVVLQAEPGFNIPILNGMAHVILKEGLHDTAYIEERCEGFDEFAASLEEFTPERVEVLTGLPAEDIREAARLYATSKPASILYAMGVTQHSQGTDAVKALANLAMLCGNVGLEGGGVNPLRGQNNVQGSCDMGCLPNVYTGYQRVDNEEAAAKFEAAWGRKLSRKPGLFLTEMSHQAVEGHLKALYVMGENPMITDPDLTHIEKALDSLELLVVQDIFLTETGMKAHVVLPAVSFAEKDGGRRVVLEGLSP